MNEAATRAPFFSVVTVVLNAERWLRRALESVFSQTFEAVETVVVDGGSTDGTLEVIASLEGRISRWVSGPDGGIYDAMNKGVGLARGEVVFFLNADDRLADPSVLAAVAAEFERPPSVDLVVGDILGSEEMGGGYFPMKPASEFALFMNGICHQAVFARRRLFEEIGGFDRRFPVCADRDWILRAIKRHRKPMRHLGRAVSVCYPYGRSSASRARLTLEAMRVNRRHYGLRFYPYFVRWAAGFPARRLGPRAAAASVEAT